MDNPLKFDEPDDWGDLPEDAPLAKAEPEFSLAKPSTRAERLKNLEEKLLETSLTTVSDALAFRDIQPGQEEAPPDWTDISPDEAIKRLRVANAAWMGKKDAPVGLELARSVAIGIIKARATEKAAPKVLNVVQIQMSAPLPQFEVVEIEEDRNG